MSIYYVIPARRNSKGFAFKNRTLLAYTMKTLSKDDLDKTIVTTDDEWILDKLDTMYCGYTNIKLRKRPKKLSQDSTSHKLVLQDVIDKFKLKNDDIIIYLYLTYPQRNRIDIENALRFYSKNNAKSLLCKKELKTSPYLMMYELPENKGEKIIDSELWRRQDYRKCFERSHFIVIFQVSELDKLNDFLWNKNTVFFKINETVDVDSMEDLERLNKNVQS